MKHFSTTKAVFILIASSLVVFTWKGLIDPKDFYALALVVFYHYYNKPKDNTTQSGDKTVPQLG